MSVRAEGAPRSTYRETLSSLRAVPAGLVVAGLVAASTVARFAAALPHSTPRYFPDEYIYAELARSIAHGSLTVRGEPANFPALLEAVLTAPLWLVGDVETSFRLTQALHALVASLVAVPVFLLARRLRLRTWECVAAALASLVLPSILFASYLTADALGLTLATTTIFAAVVALDSPLRRWQVAFVALATMTTLTRLQYVVLIPAFLVAAAVMTRFKPHDLLRRYGVVLGMLAIPVVLVATVGAGRVLGYYQGVLDLDVDVVEMIRWAGSDLLLVAYGSGYVFVPLAVTGLALAVARPAAPVERAFAVMVAATTALLLLEAALYATNGSNRFQERYLMAIGPLVPILFFVGARQLRSGATRLFAVAACAGLALAAIREPLAGYTAAGGTQDSPFLQAIAYLEARVGTSQASFLVATTALVLTVVALAAAYQPRRCAPLVTVFGIMVLAGASAAATATDSQRSESTRQLFAPEPRWVDGHDLGNVKMLVTPGTYRPAVSATLFWNTSVTELLQMRGAEVADVFGHTAASVSPSGDLLAGGLSVDGPLVVQEYASTVEFESGTLVERQVGASLWNLPKPARVLMLTYGRYLDGWLGYPRSSVTIWPTATGPRTGVLCLTLGLPASRTASIHLTSTTGLRRSISVGATPTTVAIPVSTRATRPWRLLITSATPFAAGARRVTASAELPRFVPGADGAQVHPSVCR
jgi:hypothetical protein